MPPGQGPRNASPRTQRKRPGDLTGVRGQQLAASAAAEKAEAAAQVAQGLEDQRATKLSNEVDYTSEAMEKQYREAASDVVETGEIEVTPKTKRIRVNYPIDDMTFGRTHVHPAEFDEDGKMTKAPDVGPLRTLNFEEGVWYTVDYDVYRHLLFLGYIYE